MQPLALQRSRNKSESELLPMHLLPQLPLLEQTPHGHMPRLDHQSQQRGVSQTGGGFRRHKRRPPNLLHLPE